LTAGTNERAAFFRSKENKYILTANIAKDKDIIAEKRLCIVVKTKIFSWKKYDPRRNIQEAARSRYDTFFSFIRFGPLTEFRRAKTNTKAVMRAKCPAPKGKF
jgi:hypothetical protein